MRVVKYYDWCVYYKGIIKKIAEIHEWYFIFQLCKKKASLLQTLIILNEFLIILVIVILQLTT